MLEEPIHDCGKRARDIVERLYSNLPQSITSSTTLFLVQPMRIVTNNQLSGGVILLRGDWQVTTVPTTLDHVTVGPRHLSNGIRVRVFHQNRVALFLNAIELSEGDGQRASSQIRKWIKAGWCPVWADPVTCDDLDIDASSLPFLSNRLASVPGPFESEIRALQPVSR